MSRKRSTPGEGSAACASLKINIQFFSVFVRTWSHYESKNLLHIDHSRRSFAGGSGDLMEIKIWLLIVIGLITVFAAVGAMHEYMGTKKKVDSLEERMKKLEAANRKRMPYEAFESILDARAALNKEKEEYQFFVSLIENAEAHLDKAMSAGTKREEK